MILKLSARAGVLPAMLFAALTAAFACPSASAAEHVTLRNGFELDCVRHEALDTGRIRLYLKGEGNYQDLPAADIVRIDVVPDLPSIPDAQPLVSTVTAPNAVHLSPAEMHQMLLTAGTAHNIDEDLLASVIKAESGGHVKALSHAGARGLMQLMPSTARDLGVQDAFQPDQNINGGTAYLDALLKRYKDNMSLALAAYNAGPAAVDRYHGIPPFRETRAYVARVIREFNRRKRASMSGSMSSSLALSLGTR